MKLKVILILFIVLIFCSCEKMTELDNKSFVTAIGIDKGENYNLRFTFVFTSIEKSGEKANGMNDEIVTTEAPSLYSAIEQINNFKSQTIELTHTQTIIFSEELAKEGIEDHIYMLVRSSHFRPNTYVCISKCPAMEFLNKINPSHSYHLEKYFQMLFNKMSSEKSGDLYLYDTYFSLCGDRACVMPYCSVNEVGIITDYKENTGENSTEAGKEPEEKETIGGKFVENTDDFGINTLAGNTVSQSDNPAEIKGVAVIKDGKFVSALGAAETRALQMLTNNMPGTYLTLSNPDFPSEMITCYVTLKNTKIKVNCGQIPQINIEIDLEGDFTELGTDKTFVENPHWFEGYFEEKTKESIDSFLKKIINELSCDICGFSEIAKRNFLTIEEWEKYNWKERFKNSECNVKIKLTLRTYGELSQKAGE